MNKTHTLYPIWTDVLIDSHCHLIKVLPFDEDIVQRLYAYPSLCILDIGIHPDDWEERLNTFSKLRGVYFSVGLHPCMYAFIPLKDAFDKITRHVKDAHAVGEMGIDWHKMYTSPKKQYEFFEMQLSLAQREKKPAIIHARSGLRNEYSVSGDAIESVLEVIDTINYTAGGIMHCFSGNYAQAKKCIDKGFYISFAANVSYSSSSEIQETARRIPLECLLVETDAPYLLHKKTHAMQGALKKAMKNTSQLQTTNEKGRYNHPSYLPFIYETIATLRNIPIAQLMQSLRLSMQKILIP